MALKGNYFKKEMISFFKYLYYNVYFISARNNSSPEIIAVSNISFCQTNNLLAVLNLFFFFTKIDKDYDMPKYYLIIIIALLFINYFYYVTRKKGDEIMKNEKYSLGKYKFLPDIYLILSVFLAVFTYYIYKEW